MLLRFCAWMVGLAWSVVAIAQPASDAERAKRDAEKVFSFIKFHALKKPAPAPAAPAPSPTPAPAAARSAPAAATVRALPAEPASAPVQTAVPALPAASAPPPTAVAAPLEPLAAVSTEAEAEAAGAEAIRLREFVAPALTPALLASFGANAPKVRLRFTIEADGRVSRADARDGTPRRIAAVAERALLQWRFEPLPAAQEVEVELAFQRD